MSHKVSYFQDDNLNANTDAIRKIIHARPVLSFLSILLSIITHVYYITYIHTVQVLYIHGLCSLSLSVRSLRLGSERKRRERAKLWRRLKKGRTDGKQIYGWIDEVGHLLTNRGNHALLFN